MDKTPPAHKKYAPINCLMPIISTSLCVTLKKKSFTVFRFASMSLSNTKKETKKRCLENGMVTC
jgi:hypothetical protein